MVVPAGFPQPLDTVTLLCCTHTGPPPFEQTSDRRMEWSPVGFFHKWLCVSCSRTVQTSCRAPNVECCHKWSSTAHRERDGHAANNANVASTQLQTKVAMCFFTGLLRVQVSCMGGEKLTRSGHSLGFFALSSHWD